MRSRRLPFLLPALFVAAFVLPARADRGATTAITVSEVPEPTPPKPPKADTIVLTAENEPTGKATLRSDGAVLQEEKIILRFRGTAFMWPSGSLLVEAEASGKISGPTVGNAHVLDNGDIMLDSGAKCAGFEGNDTWVMYDAAGKGFGSLHVTGVPPVSRRTASLFVFALMMREARVHPYTDKAPGPQTPPGRP